MMLNTTAVNDGQTRQSRVADDITSAVKENQIFTFYVENEWCLPMKMSSPQCELNSCQVAAIWLLRCPEGFLCFYAVASVFWTS